jgi:Ca2+-binding EF-hand superfamily protein
LLLSTHRQADGTDPFNTGKEVTMISGISSMSTASLSEMRQQMFNKIDSNSDGSIDKSEMSAFIEENASSLVSSIFGKQDTNQDSLISKIEFESEMAKLGQQMKQGNGMFGASGMSAPPPPEKVFDTADTNKDGVVTKEELAAVMGQGGGNIDQLFSQVDTDGDGSITRSEDKAFREKMATQMQQGNPSGTDTTALSGQDFQSKLLVSLLEKLASFADSSVKSTSASLYA